MYKTILVPLDGSPRAEWAIPTAIRIARATGARISLLTIDIPVPIMAAGLGILETPQTVVGPPATSEYLHAVAGRIAATGVSAQTLGVIESAGAVMSSLGVEIADRANITHADLIVMTTHARATIPLLFMGSVTRDVVRASKAPVLVVKPQDGIADFSIEPAPYRHVLIPLDDSTFSEQVVPDAVALGDIAFARYTLITVIEVPHVYGIPVAPILLPVDEVALGERNRAAQSRLDQVVAGMRKRWPQVSTHVIADGAPGEAIARIAGEAGVDLIAMTTHARGNFGTLVLGSVANHVIRSASVPVLLYRPREA